MVSLSTWVMNLGQQARRLPFQKQRISWTIYIYMSEQYALIPGMGMCGGLYRYGVAFAEPQTCRGMEAIFRACEQIQWLAGQEDRQMWSCGKASAWERQCAEEKLGWNCRRPEMMGQGSLGFNFEIYTVIDYSNFHGLTCLFFGKQRLPIKSRACLTCSMVTKPSTLPMHCKGLCRACDGEVQNDSKLGEDREDQSAPSVQKFSPVQKLLLDEVLRQDDTCQLLGPLDPSRCPEAEWWWEWHSADEDIRFSHVNISRRFRHGHPKLALNDLIAQLVANPRDSESIPALVAVKREGVLHVIMGNRRLKCYKEALKKGSNCFFKVIVHEFPDCRNISDDASRFAFRLKVIQAMSTENLGQEVDFYKRKFSR